MLNDKSILITGGTGSFGKDFTKNILNNYNIKRIVIFSRDEFNQDLIKNELSWMFLDKIHNVRFFIGLISAKDSID